VLLNLQAEHYFGLNDGATKAWHLLQEDGHLSTVRKALAHDYDAVPDKVARDLLKLVYDLQTTGLIIIETD